MNDNYDHPDDSNLVYVVENIPGPHENDVSYEEMINNFHSQITTCCTCRENCTENCNCILKAGGFNYITNNKDDTSKLRLNFEGKCFENTYITECNTLCQCSDDCGNRLVQKGPLENLIVKPCSHKLKGLGLFCRQFIPKGTFICEYAGELITKKQALERHNITNQSLNKMNYIFCLNEYCNETLVQTFIDPSKYGNVGRYINHSCEPNCFIIPVRIESPIPKLAIFSSKDIIADSEITFDYGAQNSKEKTSETSVVVTNRKKCLCESQNCKGCMPLTLYS